MTDNTARQILETISASRTQALLDEIQATKELVRSHADIFRHKFEAVQEHLVEPLFDALGFDGRYRQRVPETPNQYVVLSQQDEIAYVLAHPLWVDLRYEDVALTVVKMVDFSHRPQSAKPLRRPNSSRRLRPGISPENTDRIPAQATPRASARTTA